MRHSQWHIPNLGEWEKCRDTFYSISFHFWDVVLAISKFIKMENCANWDTRINILATQPTRCLKLFSPDPRFLFVLTFPFSFSLSVFLELPHNSCLNYYMHTCLLIGGNEGRKSVSSNIYTVACDFSSTHPYSFLSDFCMLSKPKNAWFFSIPVKHFKFQAFRKYVF